LHWGVDTQPGVLRRATDKGSNDATIQGPPGDYTAYYAQLRDALRGQRPNPVPPEQALQVMELIELGLHSWQQGRVMAL
jgi:predicted dehydrogenase